MILLTGASGFLGSHITGLLLEEGCELRLLSRNPRREKKRWGTAVEVVEGDVLDIVSLIMAMDNVEQVVHTAALVSFWNKRKNEIIQTNVQGTSNVVDACLEAGIEKLVYLSSIAAIGHEPVGTLITETSPWQNRKYATPYSLSKYKAEKEVFRGVEEGLSATLLNPGVILGPCDDWSKNTGNIFRIVYRGLNFYNKGRTGYVGAGDVARAVYLALNKDIPTGERFILAAENLSQKELLTLIAHALGKQAPRIQLPSFVSILIGMLSEIGSSISGKEPIITTASMRSAVSERRYDGSKLEAWGFAYTPIGKVIQETAAAFLAQSQK